jgi:RimJ/RimL family protein N-acetyltransferase
MVPMNDERRRFIARLLSPTAVEDALTVYYALYHNRTQIFAYGQEVVVGFLAICQTAHDLFTPLVVMRADSDDVLHALLSHHLDEGREYLFVVKEQMASVLRQCLVTWDEHFNLIYTVDEESFRPDLGHPVEKVVREERFPRFEVTTQAVIASKAKQSPSRKEEIASSQKPVLSEAEGTLLAMTRAEQLRFEIKDGKKVIAAAGTNWCSPYFAEVGVWTEEDYRGRGLARAVVSACTSELLKEGITPLYIVAEGNAASIRVCEALGYRFSGYREFSCRGRLRPKR